MDAEHEARTEYLQHRKMLIEGQASQFDTFDKHMLFLSGGAFGVSFAFIDQVVPTGWLHPGIIVAAWAMYAGAITVTMISFILSQKAYQWEIDNLDKLQQRSTNNKASVNRWTWFTGVANCISMTCFVVGTALVLLFVYLNYAQGR